MSLTPRVNGVERMREITGYLIGIPLVGLAAGVAVGLFILSCAFLVWAATHLFGIVWQ